MGRTILLSAIGLLIGVGLGCLAAFLLQPPSLPDPGWTSYPTLANPSGAVFRQVKVGEPSARACYFNGVLLGGGFGSLVGAVVGATGALLRTLNKSGSGT